MLPSLSIMKTLQQEQRTGKSFPYGQRGESCIPGQCQLKCCPSVTTGCCQKQKTWLQYPRIKIQLSAQCKSQLFGVPQVQSDLRCPACWASQSLADLSAYLRPEISSNLFAHSQNVPHFVFESLCTFSECASLCFHGQRH